MLSDNLRAFHAVLARHPKARAHTVNELIELLTVHRVPPSPATADALRAVAELIESPDAGLVIAERPH